MSPGLILAGGRATRMGGGDKGARRLAGQSLLARVIARLAPQVTALALNANGDAARFAALGLPVLADPVADHPGPLAGVLAGLDWAAGLGASHLLTVAVDTPFFPRDLAARLAAAGDFARAASPDAQGRIQPHPTFARWPVALREALRADLAGGARKLVLWGNQHGVVDVVFASAPFDPFFNINTPEDLALAETLLSNAP